MTWTCRLLVAACICLSAGCGEEPGARPTAAGPVEPVVFEKAKVSVLQRTSEPLPGFEGRVVIRLGDITRGEVLVKITTTDGDTPLSQTPMAEGDARSFVVDGRTFTVALIDLKNRLTGDDYGVFEVNVVEGDGAPSAGPPMTEAEKIEALIAAVAGLDGATFIRNGKEHTPAEAAEHMRNKWQWKRDEIQTAEDFIRVAATKSSMSGNLYLIRFSDGREVPSGEFLTEELERLD